MIDWQGLGGALAGLLLGGGGVAAWWRKSTVANARAGGEIDVIALLRGEVERLADRITAMERREGRMLRHIYRLEGLMRDAGMTPPDFDYSDPTTK